MKFLSKILFIVIALVSVHTSVGQLQDFRNYNVEHGLNQQYIYKISQNKDGFLCLSTSEGFVMFGGNTFKTFNNEAGLNEDFVNTHLVASDGTVYFGHFQSGISYLKADKIDSIPHEGINNVKITDMLELKGGLILVATQGGGLWQIKDFKLRKLNGFDDPMIIDLFQVSKSELLISGSSGLYKVSVNADKDIEIISSELIIEDEPIIKINKFDDKEFWIASKFGKIWMYKPIDNPLPELVLSDTTFEDIVITDLVFKNKKNLWIGTLGSGIYKLSFLDNEHKIFKYEQYTDKNGLSGNNIQCLYIDHESNLWIGMYGGGLTILPTQKFTVFNDQSGLKENDIYAVTPGKDGDLWVGNLLGTNRIVLGNNFQSDQYNSDNGFITDKVKTIYYDGDNIVWFGTENNGVYTYDYNTKTFENASPKYKFPNSTINYITGKKNGNIYVGTNEGLFIYVANTGETIHLNTNNGAVHNLINHLYVADDGVIWFASPGAGPYKYKDGEFTVYKDIPGLKSYNLNSICKDSKGNIWFASEGDGIFRFNEKTEAIKQFKVGDGLASNYAYTIFADSEDNIWVGHRNGLSKKIANKDEFFKITAGDGFKSIENNRNSFYIDENDDIWFGTSKGIIRYDHTEDFVNRVTPTTLILGITINSKFTQLRENMKLKHGDYSIKFDFIGVSFKNPEKVKYKYRLKGYETEWNVVGSNTRQANYPKINSGEYVFQLIACNADGVCTEREKEFAFRIDIPIYLKFWFIVTAILVLILLVILIIYYRERQSKNLQRYLESNLNIRTKELRETNGELEFVNEEVTKSINYAKRIQTAVMPSINSLEGFEEQMFILYKPRDIVSGDFYWFKKIDSQVIIVAADCTGHGVPGAMLSMIGATLLDKIIIERKIRTPSEILTGLDDNFLGLLHQFKGEDSLSDGMDVGVMTIDLDKKKIKYAGAERPLYFMNCEGEFHEFKGTPHPIGGYLMAEKKFEEVEFDYQKGCQVLMSSDGYADQFGGPRDKKFYTKNLKKKFMELKANSPAEQMEEYDKAFEDWKGDEEQVDDVLLIGVNL